MLFAVPSLLALNHSLSTRDGYISICGFGFLLSGEKRDCTGIQFKPPGCWVPLPWLKVVKSMQIAEALQMQMEVQKKLYEQIEVQRHLQLKIEAQGKYLQSVLHKAQELAGMINNGSPGSPPISKLTETRGGFSWSCGQRKQNRGTMCSLEI
nr:myb family transcription factor PHL8-like [Arachis hypogaea]